MSEKKTSLSERFAEIKKKHSTKEPVETPEEKAKAEVQAQMLDMQLGFIGKSLRDAEQQRKEFAEGYKQRNPDATIGKVGEKVLYGTKEPRSTVVRTPQGEVSLDPNNPLTQSILGADEAEVERTAQGAANRKKVSEIFGDPTVTDYSSQAIRTAFDYVEELPKNERGEIEVGGIAYTPTEVAQSLVPHVTDIMSGKLFGANAKYRDDWARSMGYDGIDGYLAAMDERLAALQDKMEGLADKSIESRATRGFVAPHAMAQEDAIGMKAVRDARDQIAAMRNGSWQLGQGFVEGFDLRNALSGGLTGVVSEVGERQLINKIKDGKELTPAEQLQLDVIDIQSELDMLDDARGVSFWRNTGRYLGSTAEVMSQMAMTMPLARGMVKPLELGIKVAWDTTKKAGRKSIARGIGQGIFEGLKVTGKGLANLGQYALAGTLLSPLQPSTYSRFLEKRNAQYSYHNGKLEYMPTNAWEDFINTTIEQGAELSSELFGIKLAEVIGMTLKGLGRIIGLQKMSRKTGLFNVEASKIFGWKKPQSLRYMEQNLGFSGDFISEGVSESWGDFSAELLKSVVTGDGHFEEFKNPSFWATTFAVSGIFGGAMSMASYASGYRGYLRDMRVLGKKKADALSHISHTNLKNALISLSSGDSIADATKALAELDWSAYDMTERGYAMDYLRAEAMQQVIMGENAESARLVEFGHKAAVLENLAYKGTKNIVYVQDTEGNIYYLLEGNVKDKEAMLTVMTVEGKKMPLHAGKVQGVSPMSITDATTQMYQSSFNVGVAMDRLDDATETMMNMENPSVEEIRNVAKTIGITIPDVGGVITLVDGRQMIVESVNSNIGIVASYANEAGEMEMVQVHVDHILSNDANIAEAQRLQMANNALEVTEAALDAETIESGDTGEGAIVTLPNGNKGTIVGYNEDGTVMVDVNPNSRGRVAEMAIETYTREEIEAANPTPAIPEATATEGEDAISAEMEATANAVVEAKPIPMKDGEVDYDAITDVEQFAEVFTSEMGDREAAANAVVAMRDGLVAEMTANVQRENEAKTPNDIIRLRKENRQLAERIAFYDNVINKMLPEEPVKEDSIATTTYGLEENELSEQLTPEVRELLDNVAIGLGVHVVFEEEVRTDTGAYANADINGNKVRIAWRNRDKALSFLIGHEFTHRMQDISPETYAKLKDAVKAYVGEARWNQYLGAMIATYEAAGYTIVEESTKEAKDAPRRKEVSITTIEDEIIADEIGKIVEDENAFKAFVSSEDVREKRTVLEAIKAFIENLIAKFRGIPKKVAEYENMTAILDTLIMESVKLGKTAKETAETTSNGQGEPKFSLPVVQGVYDALKEYEATSDIETFVNKVRDVNDNIALGHPYLINALLDYDEFGAEEFERKVRMIVGDYDDGGYAPYTAGGVKFSLITPEMDASYLDAVERGDMETAQRMVMEAAKLAMPNTKVVDEDGNPKVVYHQTNATVYINRETGQNWDELDWHERMEWDERDDWDDYWEEREFNTFSRVNARTTQELDGFFFAPEYDEYHEYGDRTISAFLNITNPASFGDYNIDSSQNNAGRDERIRLQNEGYDGVINEEDGTIWEYVAFSPNQIKSADPVTYDDAGNVIPLSERFNPEKEDIRYSIMQPTNEEVTFDNFFKKTSAVFELMPKSEVPQREPDYVSVRWDGFGVSSRYWYGEDERGKYVIRESDHWSDYPQGERTREAFEAEPYDKRYTRIASCRWALAVNEEQVTTDKEAYLDGNKMYGKAYLDEFTKWEDASASAPAAETQTLTTANGDMVADVNEATGQGRFSLRTYREGGRDVLADFLATRVADRALTEREASEMIQQMDDIYNLCMTMADEYEPFGKWSEAKVVEDENGNPVFSVIKANGDYAMNLDFSLVCKKRRTLDAVLNEMVKRGMIKGVSQKDTTIAKINEVIRKYGFETACALCFVDARRFQILRTARKFCDLYNEVVDMLIPKNKRYPINEFNFAGRSGVTTQEGSLETIADEELNVEKLRKIGYKVIGKTKEGKDIFAKTVLAKIARHLVEHPEDRKYLVPSDFVSTRGFDHVKQMRPLIMKLYNAKKGTGGPKAAYSDTQYLNDIIRSNWKVENAYAVGGVRLQSFSDYVPRMVFDYIQMVAELAAKELPVHAYTKEPLFAKTFGLTGIKINLSLVPDVVAGGVAAGLDADGNYVWRQGETFPYEEAIALQNAEGYRDNCGTIAVGVSDAHILKMLDDPNIRMVIPYHKSGLPVQVAKMNNVAAFTDYTKIQNTTRKGRSLTKEEAAKVPNYNEFLQKLKDPRKAAAAYVAWCETKGYTPKFAKFAEHPNYYKLLEDFTTLVDNKYVPQGAVTFTFPTEESAFGSLESLIEQGLEEDAVTEGMRDARVGAIVDEVGEVLGVKPDARYSIIGEIGAANLDTYGRYGSPMLALEFAREFEAEGKSAKDIRLATNWERGVDGKWRYEILDGVYNHPTDDDITAKEYRLADILDNADLYKAYPYLKDIKVEYKPKMKSRGTYYNGVIELNASRTPEQINSTLLHEVQHAIQHIEMFATGGNTDMFKDQEVINQLMREIEALGEDFRNTSNANIIRKAYLIYQLVKRGINIDSIDSKAFKAYSRLAGEVESRNVQKRMRMTEAQRLETLLSATEDVARKDQEMLFDEYNASAAIADNDMEVTSAPRYSINSSDIPFFNDENGEVIYFDNTDVAQDFVEDDVPRQVVRRDVTEEVVRAYLKGKYLTRKERIRKEARQQIAVARQLYKEADIRRREGIASQRSNAGKVEYILGDTPYESLGFEDMALVAIAEGDVKIRWEDDGTRRGLASELGLSDGERKSYRQITKGATLTFEAFVHKWWESLGGYEKGIDTQDLRNALIEALMAANTANRALEILRKKYDHAEEEMNNAIYDIESERDRLLAAEDAAYAEQERELQNPATMRYYVESYASNILFSDDLNTISRTIREMGAKIRTAEEKVAEARNSREKRTEAIREMQESLAEAKDVLLEALSTYENLGFGRAEVQRLVDAVKGARTLRDISKVRTKVESILLNASIREKRNMMNKLIQLRLPNGELLETFVGTMVHDNRMSATDGKRIISDMWKGQNAKGVSVAKIVDDDTRILLENIRGMVMAIHKGHFVKEEVDGEEVRRYIPAAENTMDIPSSLEANEKRMLELIEKEIGGTITAEERTELEARSVYPAYLFVVLGKQNVAQKRKEIEELFERIKARREGDYAREEREQDYAMLEQLQREHNECKKLYEQALDDFNDSINNIIIGGRVSLREFRENKEKHKAEVIRMAIDAMGIEDKDINTAQPTRIEEAMAKYWRGLLNVTYWTFDTALREIDRNAPNGEGKFYEYIMGRYVKAVNGLQVRTEQHIEALGDAVRDIWYRGKKISPQKALKKVMEEADATSLDIIMRYKVGEKKETPVVRQLRISNGLFILAMWGQEQYRTIMMKHGIDEDFIADVESRVREIDERYLILKDWVIKTMLPATREEYNKTHVELFGASMDNIANYFPAKVMEGYREVDMSEAESGLPSTMTGSIIKRQPHNNMIDASQSFFSVLLGHLQNMDHWASFAPLIEDINAILSNNDFKNRAKTLFPGTEANRGGAGSLVQILKDTAAIAMDCYRVKHAATDELLGMMAGAWTASNISWRLSTAIKQLSGSVAFLTSEIDGVTQIMWLKNMATFIDAMKWASERSPMFRKRWNGRFAGNEVLQQYAASQSKGMDLRKGKTSRAIDKVEDFVRFLTLEMGMLPNAAVDAVVVATGMKTIYDATLRKVTNGKPETATQEQKDIAMMKAEIFANETQQSAEGAYLSVPQAQRSAATTMATTYMNASYAAHRMRVGGAQEIIRAIRAKENPMSGVSRLLTGVAIDASFVAMTYLGRGLWNIILDTIGYEDDDESQINWKDYGIDVAISLGTGGILGGNIIQSLVSGYGVTALPAATEFFKDLGKATGISAKDIAKIKNGGVYGEDWKIDISLYAIGNILLKYRFGVDAETFVNMVRGVENICRDGDPLGTLQILNSPASTVNILVGRRRKGETVKEYVERRMRYEVIGKVPDFEDIYDEEIHYIGDGILDRVGGARDYKLRSLYKEFAERQYNAVYNKMLTAAERAEYEILEKEYLEVCEALGWKPDRQPTLDTTKVDIPPQYAWKYHKVKGIATEMNKMRINMDRFVGTDSTYLEMLKARQAKKRELIETYNEYLR